MNLPLAIASLLVCDHTHQNSKVLFSKSIFISDKPYSKMRNLFAKVYELIIFYNYETLLNFLRINVINSISLNFVESRSLLEK